MTYFLGRDVETYITTEAASGSNADGLFATTGGAVSVDSASPADSMRLCLPLNSGASGGELLDITGLDVSLGSMDEDISYFGIRSQTKAEIKKETTVTITRKKSDSRFDTMFNSARYGVSGTSKGNYVSVGLSQPSAQKAGSDISYGYRIHVVLKSGATNETLSIPNACLQAHTVALNADGVQEETLEFMSYVTPVVAGTANVTATTSANI